MDRQPSSDVKAPTNEPRELLARLYREIGVSAVAAALAPERLADCGPAATPQAQATINKAAA